MCSWTQTTGWVADSPEAPPVPASKVSDEHKAEQITLKAISSISHYLFLPIGFDATIGHL